MLWYEENASDQIADEFFDELMATLDAAAEKPELCHPDTYDERLKRANLKRFPYHFLFKEKAGHIYIVVVRHDKRHPSFGHRADR
jgi:plasmid stabilization system protein ParE